MCKLYITIACEYVVEVEDVVDIWRWRDVVRGVLTIDTTVGRANSKPTVIAVMKKHTLVMT